MTENVDKNPNLLRAIAADDHEIASHSDSHVPLATSKKGAYHNLTAKETAAMRKDPAKSYQKLNKYVGDVQVGGKKALSLDFRPPTLEVSKKGLEAAFDVGFQYAVSGDVSTNDYEQTSFQKYLHDLKYESGKDDNDYKDHKRQRDCHAHAGKCQVYRPVFGHYDSCLEKRGLQLCPG